MLLCKISYDWERDDSESTCKNPSYRETLSLLQSGVADSRNRYP